MSSFYYSHCQRKIIPFHSFLLQSCCGCFCKVMSTKRIFFHAKIRSAFNRKELKSKKVFIPWAAHSEWVRRRQPGRNSWHFQKKQKIDYVPIAISISQLNLASHFYLHFLFYFFLNRSHHTHKHTCEYKKKLFDFIPPLFYIIFIQKNANILILNFFFIPTLARINVCVYVCVCIASIFAQRSVKKNIWYGKMKWNEKKEESRWWENIAWNECNGGGVRRLKRLRSIRKEDLKET